ncbi:MAG: VCBS repeat-containing protein [Phycisphaerales bacterium]|nr:VCBS repeat-containing protein [Phycisphaerales bacterium]
MNRPCTRRALTSLLALVGLAPTALSQVYSTSPDWTSLDMQVSTGAALVDLNRDGWLDLVVSNGNDISLQRLVVYYNDGTGQLERSPSWQSANTAYHGHLDVGDVNADGWPDVAVGILLAQGGTSARLYMNNNGVLNTTAAWSAPVSGDTFGVSFGDMNGDGRPDLAVASGEAYNNVPKRNCVYLNVGGALSTSVSWETATTKNFNTCIWLDRDRDGLLDLCYNGSNTDTFVYRNLGTTLETTATWRTNDSRNQFCLMATTGDVTGDGLRELILADNNQLFSGSGRFRQYNGLGAGNYSTTANWTYSDGYTAAVFLGDINNDHKIDLCTGEWFGRSRYFLNNGTGFAAASTWQSAGTSTVERIYLGDVDNKSRRVKAAQFSGSSKLVHLPTQPVEDVLKVVVDSVTLPRSQWCASREFGWVSIGVTPASSVRVVYIASASLDMAVSNWDDNRPNQLYYNKTTPPCGADFNEDGFVNALDYDGFAEAFEIGDETGDFNIDGFVNGLDYDAFAEHFEAGC